MALGVLVALLVATVSTTVLTRAGARPDHCATVAQQAARRAAVVTGRTGEPQVLVIGDSYSVGAGLAPQQSWPTRLPGHVRVDGFSGSGFSRGASSCGEVSYATRAARSLRAGTDLVVVEGGLNDTDQPLADVEAGFTRLVDVLHRKGISTAHLVVVGPAPAPARRAANVAAVDATLARMCEAYGASYLSMREVRLAYQADRLHPTAASQRTFGNIVARQLSSGE